ncbi:MAG: hypothetical protein ACLFVH_14330, partial [Phycisphaerae bacterium]
AHPPDRTLQATLGTRAHLLSVVVIPPATSCGPYELQPALSCCNSNSLDASFHGACRDEAEGGDGALQWHCFGDVIAGEGNVGRATGDKTVSKKPLVQ